MHIRSWSVLWQFQDYDLKIRSWLSLLYQFIGRDKLLLRDPGLEIHVMVFIPSTCSRITSRVSSRIWRGVMWCIYHPRADSVVWLSHTSSVWPWSGVPIVHLYDNFLGGLRQNTFMFWPHSIFLNSLMFQLWLVVQFWRRCICAAHQRVPN